MKRIFLLMFGVLALPLTAERATAGTWIGETWPGWYVTYVPQTVTCWRPETFYRDVETTVDLPHYRTETRQFNVTVLEEDFRNEEHTGTFHKYVPRKVEVDVQRWRLVPVKMTNPLTGTVCTICLPEAYTQRQEQIVYDRVAEQRKYTERVSFFKPVEKVYEQEFQICEMVPATVTVRQPFTRLVPYEASLLVPVPAPAGFPVTRPPCCK